MAYNSRRAFCIGKPRNKKADSRKKLWQLALSCLFCVKNKKIKNGIAFVRVLEYNIIYNRQGV